MKATLTRSKWILNLNVTSHYCLRFGHNDIGFEGFTDANMARDMDTKKSPISYLYTFEGATISYKE